MKIKKCTVWCLHLKRRQAGAEKKKIQSRYDQNYQFLRKNEYKKNENKILSK